MTQRSSASARRRGTLLVVFAAVHLGMVGALVEACSSSNAPVATGDNGGGGTGGDATTPDVVTPPAGDASPDAAAVDGDATSPDGSAADAADATQPTPPYDGPYDGPIQGFDTQSFADVPYDQNPGCSFLTCAIGCCAIDGTCDEAGTSNTSCGSQGVTCQDCTLTSKTCQNQTCQ